MRYCMVPECTNHSRKTVGISYHEIPKEKNLREAWLARIRRVHKRDINHSCICSAHFTPDFFERTLDLVPGYQKRPKLKPDAVSSIFPRSKAEKPRNTVRRRNQIRSKQARQKVLHVSKLACICRYIIKKLVQSFSIIL
jgi:uncharacterized protein YnzC (UPF0291/DUF896 family)